MIRTSIASLQWFLFMISNSLIVPVVIASQFHLNAADSIEFLQRTLFVLAVSGLLQIFIGHKYPIMEGPAGVWWGVFSLYAGLGTVLFGSDSETLRVLQFTMIASGVIAILMSIFGLIDKLAKYFTPTVTGTYLILLVAQLSGSFLKGMFGITESSPTIKLPIAFTSAAILLLAFYLLGHRTLNKLSIIITIIVGWGLFNFLGLTKPIEFQSTIFYIPELFVFGSPKIEWSMVVTAFFVTLILITNMLASIRVVESVYKRTGEKAERTNVKKAGLVSGLSQLLGGGFSAVGAVPISGSGGFISATGIYQRMPFIIALCLLLFVSIFTPLTSIMSALPPAVGYAAIFPVFASMIALGMSEFNHTAYPNQAMKKAGIPLLAGIGVMFLPSEAFSSLPPLATTFLSNGLVLGTLIILAIEIYDSVRSKEPDTQSK
ncbi:purine permease [Priestia megaterium]|nr:purine permease [Priestia megaterium]